MAKKIEGLLSLYLLLFFATLPLCHPQIQGLENQGWQRVAKWQTPAICHPHFLVLREIFEKNPRFLVFEQTIQEIYRTNPIFRVFSINRAKIGARGEKKAASMVFCSRPTVFH